MPTSKTTKHVARTPMAEGSVNAKGQRRYTDPKTGKVAFIDMKQGAILSPEGRPVKTPKWQ